MEVIFIHIPKTAGCSIRAILPDNNFGHNSAKQVREKIGEERWEKAFKFAVVRNPYDRLVSLYFYFKQFKPYQQWYRHNKKIIAQVQSYESFKDFVLHLKNFKYLDNYHFQPQSAFIDNSMDLFLQMEELNEEWPEVAHPLGLPKELPARNKTDHKPWQDYYTEAMKEVVRDLYKQDFNIFGYEH